MTKSIPQRVNAAIQCLQEERRPVSLRAIARAAERLDGRPMAVSSIERNPEAYALYSRHRCWRPPRMRLRKAASGPWDAAVRQRMRQLMGKRRRDLVRLVLEAEAVVAVYGRELAVLKAAPPQGAQGRRLSLDGELAKHFALLAADAAYRRRFRIPWGDGSDATATG